MSEEKPKKKMGCLARGFIIFGVITMIGVFTASKEEAKHSTPKTEKVVEEVKTEEKTLQEHYNRHKNYIWYVCQEGLKLIDGGPYNFEGPTYAGEYMGKFIVKGTNRNRLFRCEYVPFDNERGMNLEDVRYEE